jgi:hypothetical protein
MDWSAVEEEEYIKDLMMVACRPKRDVPTQCRQVYIDSANN